MASDRHATDHTAARRQWQIVKREIWLRCVHISARALAPLMVTASVSVGGQMAAPVHYAAMPKVAQLVK